MIKNSEQRTSISKAATYEEIGEFWDSHSLADYWGQTYEVEFEVRAKRRRRVTLDPEVYEKVEAQAHTRGVSPETLVNLVDSRKASSGQCMNTKNGFPPGWDEARVRRVLAFYEAQSEDEAVAEDEAVFEKQTQTIMKIPVELVPAVRELIGKHQSPAL